MIRVYNDLTFTLGAVQISLLFLLFARSKALDKVGINEHCHAQIAEIDWQYTERFRIHIEARNIVCQLEYSSLRTFFVVIVAEEYASAALPIEKCKYKFVVALRKNKGL